MSGNCVRFAFALAGRATGDHGRPALTEFDDGVTLTLDVAV